MMMMYMLLPISVHSLDFVSRRSVMSTSLVSGLYYTKEDYCKNSDASSKNGIEFGCEAYASEEKKEKMRKRATAQLHSATKRLDEERLVLSNRDGERLRSELRTGELGSLRRDGQRLAALVPSTAPSYSRAIASIENLDLALRKLELFDNEETRDLANKALGDAREKLRAFDDLLLDDI